MDTFGEKLRKAIEGQELGLEEVAQATGFQVDQLQALQQGDFSALPGDEFVIERLREVARLVDEDPDMVIEDYMAERVRHRPEEAETLEEAIGLPVSAVPEVLGEQLAERPAEPETLEAAPGLPMSPVQEVLDEQLAERPAEPKTLEVVAGQDVCPGTEVFEEQPAARFAEHEAIEASAGFARSLALEADREQPTVGLAEPEAIGASAGLGASPVPEVDQEQPAAPRPEPEALEAPAGLDAYPAPEAEVFPVPEPVHERSAATPTSGLGFVALGLVALAVAAGGFLWFRWSQSPGAQPAFSGEERAPVAATPRSVPAGAEPAAQPAESPSQTVKPAAQLAESDAPPARPLARPVDQSAPATGAEQIVRAGMSIPRHGVGTGVVDHELVGETGQFAEGSLVWFWTHVQGATPGQRIHHVWIHEGREVLSTPLRLGGARWRTQSYKTLHPGSKGDWVVEARDDGGQVLARSAFVCSP